MSELKLTDISSTNMYNLENVQLYILFRINLWIISPALRVSLKLKVYFLLPNSLLNGSHDVSTITQYITQEQSERQKMATDL